MSEEINFSAMVKYLAAFALVLFYLMYLPYTLTTGFLATANYNPVLMWLYYFSLVIGLLVPLYFGLGKENMMWLLLGLSIILNSVVVLGSLDVMTLADPAMMSIAAIVTLIVGLIWFLQPFLEDKFSNWDFMKALFQLINGLLLTLGAVFFAMALSATWDLDSLLFGASYNHIMPQFLFLGGGLTIAWGIVLFLYGLFKILQVYMPGKLGELFEDLIKIFYTLLIIVFLIGVTYNVMMFTVSSALVNPWMGILTMGAFPSSIAFFVAFWAIGVSTLVAFLLVLLYITGIVKIVEKNQ
ncbi:MAG: hypothetical protein ACTSUO_05175 [Candidatus Thorarchaeota archaeon]